MPPKRTKEKARELYWRKAIARHAESGLSQSEFCKREGVSANSFSFWKIRIAKADFVAAGGHPVPEAGSTFVPVSVRQNAEGGASSSQAVAEIDLPSSTVRIFSGIDAATLKAILIAIKESKK